MREQNSSAPRETSSNSSEVVWGNARIVECHRLRDSKSDQLKPLREMLVMEGWFERAVSSVNRKGSI